MHQDETRARVLAAASRLLSSEGPDALSNRRIAEAAKVTTMAIYSRFGSKGGVLDALYVEGVETLARAQAAVSDAGDPLIELRALCQAYRATAIEHAGHYRILFGHVSGWEASVEARERLFATFARLERAVTRAVDAGAVDGDPRTVAFALFATCHGLVTLELDGYSPPLVDPSSVYESAIDRVLSS